MTKDEKMDRTTLRIWSRIKTIGYNFLRVICNSCRRPLPNVRMYVFVVCVLAAEEVGGEEGVNSSHFLSPHCFLCVLYTSVGERERENERGETTKSTMHNACLNRANRKKKKKKMK